MKLKLCFLMVFLLSGCAYTQYTNYQDKYQEYIIVKNEKLSKEEVTTKLKEILTSEWAPIEFDNNMGIITKWKGTRDKRGGYIIPTPFIVAFGKFSSGTPGAFRIIANISEEKPYKISLKVEAKILTPLDPKPEDLYVTQEDVDKVAKGIQGYIIKDMEEKFL
jgi:hypothetical protein